MGKITLSNVTFKPASIVYSRVNRMLKSFGIASMVDEGEFPVYTKDIIGALGLGALMESRAVIEIADGKACLPHNFKYLYAAYKCSPNFECNSQVRKHIQGSSFSYNIDITDSIAIVDNSCEINCCSSGTGYMETVSVNTYVKDVPVMEFSQFTPLTLVPDLTGPSHFPHSIGDISIEGTTIYTMFKDDFIFVQFYGFPVDEDGELLILDAQKIEDAVVWHIIYNVLLGLWFDPSIPDIQNKIQMADMKCQKTLLSAKNYLKTPSFAQMINTIKGNSQNMLAYMTKEYTNTNYQKTF